MTIEKLQTHIYGKKKNFGLKIQKTQNKLTFKDQLAMSVYVPKIS